MRRRETKKEEEMIRWGDDGKEGDVTSRGGGKE
jgi:hypothetical protein